VRLRILLLASLALSAALGACRWETEPNPRFRRAASPDSMAMFASEIDPGREVRIAAGHGFLSISDPWIELRYESHAKRELLLSGALSEATQKASPLRPIRVAAMSAVPTLVEISLLGAKGESRSTLFAVPGGNAEVVGVFPPEAWIARSRGVKTASRAAEWQPQRFEVHECPGPSPQPSTMKLRVSIPSAIDEGTALAVAPPFTDKIRERITPSHAHEPRIEAAWRGACIGAAVGHAYEGRTRKEIRESARKMRPAIDTTFATGPSPQTTMMTAALVACLETAGRLPRPAHLAEVYSARVIPEFLPASVMRGLASMRAGTLPHEMRAPVLEPGPAWDEDTEARARSMIWGLLFPGDPYRAASAAMRDASITHAAAAVEDARYGAALVAAALATPAPELAEILDLGESFLGGGSETEMAILGARETWQRTRNLDSTSIWIENTWVPRAEERHPGMPWMHALPNAAAVVLALEAGGGDFERTIRLAASFGLDADTNAATCGAILGARRGPGGIPGDLFRLPGDSFRSAVVGAENWRLRNLASTIIAVSGAMKFDPTEEW
jgi:ADP-ribosylglycohydrolase